MKREKVYIVDKDDNVLGTKWRDELINDDCWRVVAIWVKDRAENILLQQRSFQKKIGPGIWSAACEGTIEAGDTPVETAIRELKEELGLKVATNELKSTNKIYYKDPQFGWRIKYGFILNIAYKEPQDFVIQEEEVEQLKWFNEKSLDEFIADNPDKFVLAKEYKQLGFTS